MRSKKAIINILTSLVLQLITVICGFIIPRLIIKNFGSSVNGLVTSITQFLAYITLLESGFGPVVKSVLYKPIANKDKNETEKILKASEKFFRTISYIFIVYIISLCFALPAIVSSEFNVWYTLSLVIIISISTFAEYYFGMTYKLYLQAEQKAYVTSIIQIGTTILNTIMIVLLIYLGANIQVVKLFSAIIFVFRPILQNIYVKKKYNINLKGIKSDYKIKQKWDGLAQHVAAVIFGNTDVAVLTIFANVAEVSVYSIYSLVTSGIQKIVQAFIDGIGAIWGDMYAKGEDLNKNFKIYEACYYTLITILYACTMFLILPFVSLYTRDITDVNYYRYTFAILIVLSQLGWAIRQPFSELVKAAGHFKQTQKGAWVEAILNIVISVLFVVKFGIVGVAIGTLTAMIIRTVEYIFYTSKNLLHRAKKESCKKIIIIIIEILLIMVISNISIDIPKITTYFTLIICGVKTLCISLSIVLPINMIIYKNEFKEIISKVRRLGKQI